MSLFNKPTKIWVSNALTQKGIADTMSKTQTYKNKPDREVNTKR